MRGSGGAGRSGGRGNCIHNVFYEKIKNEVPTCLTILIHRVPIILLANNTETLIFCNASPSLYITVNLKQVTNTSSSKFSCWFSCVSIHPLATENRIDFVTTKWNLMKFYYCWGKIKGKQWYELFLTLGPNKGQQMAGIFTQVIFPSKFLSAARLLRSRQIHQPAGKISTVKTDYIQSILVSNLVFYTICLLKGESVWINLY